MGESSGIAETVRLLAFILVSAFAGCASPQEKARIKYENDEYAAKKALAARRKKSAMGSGDAASERGADVIVWDDTKTFNPAVARFGNRASVSDKLARTGEFRFTEQFRAKEFGAKGFSTKSAWVDKLSFATKDAPTRDAREAGKTAGSKSYDTVSARETGKTAALPDVPDGERKYLGKEADRMKRGINPRDQPKFEGAWTGNLEPLTIDDVKKLLNKN